MKSFSEQLSDLTKRAQAAQDSAAAAGSEMKEQVTARVEQVQSDAQARSAQVEERVRSADAAVDAGMRDLSAQVRRGVEGIKDRINARQVEIDAAASERQANRAEHDAAEAISLAFDAIDYAEASVLEAMLARLRANSNT